MGDEQPPTPEEPREPADPGSTRDDTSTPGVSDRAEGAIDRLLQSPALSWLADDIRPLEERYNNKTTSEGTAGDGRKAAETTGDTSDPATGTAKTVDASGTTDGVVSAGEPLPPGARLPRPAPELEPDPPPPPRRPRPEPDPPDAMDKILDALIGSRALRWALSLVAIVFGLPAVLGIWVLDPITKTTHVLASDQTSAGAVVDVVQCWHSESALVYAVELIETAADGTRRFETLGYANQKIWAGAELNVVGDEAFVDFPDGPLWARVSESTTTSLSNLRPLDSAEPTPNICN